MDILYFKQFIYFYFWLGWVLVAACGLSPVVASGRYSLGVGFSMQWLLLLQSRVSRAHRISSCSSQALKHGLCSCGTRAQLLWGLCNLPRLGVEPMCPALAGGLLTTGPLGKCCMDILNKANFIGVNVSEG